LWCIGNHVKFMSNKSKKSQNKNIEAPVIETPATDVVETPTDVVVEKVKRPKPTIGIVTDDLKDEVMKTFPETGEAVIKAYNEKVSLREEIKNAGGVGQTGHLKGYGKTMVYGEKSPLNAEQKTLLIKLSEIRGNGSIKGQEEHLGYASKIAANQPFIPVTREKVEVVVTAKNPTIEATVVDETAIEEVKG